MTIAESILAGLARGPSTLPELLPDAKPGDRTANAFNLERLGRIRRTGEKVLRYYGIGAYRAVVWERVRPAATVTIAWSPAQAFAQNEQRFQAVH